MKAFKTLITTLLFCVICTGCNGKKVIKITIDAGVGSFMDNSTTITLIANPGIKLSECNFTAPTISNYKIEEYPYDIEDIPVLNYLTKDNEIFEDVIISNDIVLYANYYVSLDKEKEIAKNTITTIYEELAKSDFLTEQYEDAILKINNATTSYEIFFLVNNCSNRLGGISLAGEALRPIIEFQDNVLNTAIKYKNDQRIMSYIKPLEATLKTNDISSEMIELYKKTLAILNEYIGQISTNIAYIIGEPFYDFIAALNHQKRLSLMLEGGLDVYAEACTHCDTTAKVAGLAHPLTGLSRLGIVSPELIEESLVLYKNYVKTYFDS